MNHITVSLLCCAAAATLISSPAIATPGDLYVSDVDNVETYSSAGLKKGTAANGFSLAQGLAFDNKANVFVADAGGTIYKITPAGVRTAYASNLGPITGLAFDNAGNLFVAQSFASQITQIDLNGAKTVFATGLSIPAALAFDDVGDLYEADSGSGKVYRITPAGVKTVYASGFSQNNGAFGLAFDAADNLFVSDTNAGTIIKITPSGTRTTFASGIGGPKGLAFDAAGNLFVVDAGGNGTPFHIVLITPNGTKSTFVTAGFDFIAFEPALHQLLNISTRAFVQAGDRALIAGFIVGGNGQVGSTIVARALGPSLTAAGVPDVLLDPTLEIHDNSGALVVRNDDWKGSQQTQLQALGLAPSDMHESALITTLRSGAYTAIVRGFNNTTGNALVEVYNLQ